MEASPKTAPFTRLENWDAEAVMKLFRERLLARLVERHAISDELARNLVAWTHPGFSSHIGEAIPSENKKAIEGSGGRNFEAMDPLEWLARLADHIPDPGRHSHFYAHYANRVRCERPGWSLPALQDRIWPWTRYPTAPC